MAIGPERMAYMMSMLKKAISVYYGDTVPDMKTFKDRRKKTFMEKLKEEVGFSEWMTRISAATQENGTAKGVVTRLTNERAAKRIELQAKQQQERDELKAKHTREDTELIAHYEPKILEAGSAQDATNTALEKVKRESYFAGLITEDDGRRIYGGTGTIEDALMLRVDVYIEQNLSEDEEGKKVLRRVHEESMVSDIAYIVEKISELRESVLKFIAIGKLPPITIEAWGIEKGTDLTKGIE